MSDIKHTIARLIETTENPLAPIIIQDAIASVERLGRVLMVPMADQAKTTEFHEKCLAAFPDEELERVFFTPDFIVALCAMLTASIKGYVSHVANEDKANDVSPREPQQF